jgi:uncharacterized protein (DUF427 family)
MWEYKGQRRPDFAIAPGAGQESVWDYPRPPALVKCSRTVSVTAGGRTIARSNQALRVLETASPPTVYVPPADVDFDCLAEVTGSSFCEWKGAASYYSLAGGGRVVAWQYRHPLPDFGPLRDYVSFYPGRVTCLLDDEEVQPQAGEFYGGWVTADIVGPFKGDPGTGHW